MSTVDDKLSDYMKSTNTRFTEICNVYLRHITIEDLKFMKPEDLINLVPSNQYSHKELMTIMVRRYIFRDDDIILDIGSKSCESIESVKPMDCGYSKPKYKLKHKSKHKKRMCEC